MFKIFSKIKKRISSNKDGKVLIQNFAYLSLLQVAGYIFPLITMPYLARVIGVDGFGKIAFALAINSWVQTFIDWGFDYTATRDLAQSRSDSNRVSEIFSNILWARVLLVIISLITLLILTLTIPLFIESQTVILITFLMLPGHILFPEWFFQAMERMKYITILNLLVKIICTSLIFIFINHSEDYIYQPLFVSIGYLICGILSLWIILGRWGYRLKAPNFHNIVTTIKNSSDVFINNFAPNLYNSLSVMILGASHGSVANGIFDGGNKFFSIIHRFHSILSRVFFPFISRKTNQIKLYARINIISGSIIAIIIFITAPLIVGIMLTPEFADSVIVLRFFAISMFFMLLSNTYGTNYLIIIHKEKILRNITILSSLTGMLLAYPLIKHYSYIGAALTVLFTRVLLGTSIWLYARTQMKRNQ